MEGEKGTQISPPPSSPDYTEICEGKAKLVVPKENSVFYNPVQVFNRDLSLAVIDHYAKKYWRPHKRQKRPFWKSSSEKESNDKLEGSTSEAEPAKTNPIANNEFDRPNLKILEALAASGLRSIRYALEIQSSPCEILTNDYSHDAYQSIINNAQINGVSGVVTASCKDARAVMYEHSDPLKRFNVVDIDPYGSPAVFLDSAVQSVHEGGLLCVTCTDTSILCGNFVEACFAKYGSVSLKTKYKHEMGLRIILSSLNSHAGRYDRYIHPLLSVSTDFYFRIFVTLYTSPLEVKKSASKVSMVYHCDGCSSFYLQSLNKLSSNAKNGSVKTHSPSGPPVDRKCEHCNSNFKFCGPIWSDPIHDNDFVSSLLSDVKESGNRFTTNSKMIGMLSMINEELNDVPLFHDRSYLSKVLHCNTISIIEMNSALLNEGFRVSSSHTNPLAVKTDAPHSVIWDIMREWVKRQSPAVKTPDHQSPAAVILNNESSTRVNFDLREDAESHSRRTKLVRFPVKPPNWGPRARAKRKAQDTESISNASKKDKTTD